MKKVKRFFTYLLAIIISITLFSSCNDKANTIEEKPVEITEQFDFTNSNHINWFGRTYLSDENEMNFNNTISGFELNFYGTQLTAEITAQGGASGKCWLAIFIDKETDPQLATALELKDGTNSYKLVEGLNEDIHTIKVLRRTEIQFAPISALKSISCDGKFYTPPKKETRKIDYYGASSNCGYGSLGETDDLNFSTDTEDGTSAFSYYASTMLNAQSNVFCASGWGLGVSTTRSIPNVFEQYTINNKTNWNFENYVADVVVINLGYNDQKTFGSSGTQLYLDKREEFKELLLDFCRKIYMYYPDSYIYISYGIWSEYQIYDLYQEVVKELNDEGKTKVIAFKLYTPKTTASSKEIGSVYHASYVAHKKMAEGLSADIKEKMGW